MLRVVTKWAIATLTILLIPYVVPGIEVFSLRTAVIAAAVLGVLNVVVKPLLVFATLPLTIVTLGAFLLVINAGLFLWMGNMVSGVIVRGFWSAFFAALVLSVIMTLTHRRLIE